MNSFLLKCEKKMNNLLHTKYLVTSTKLNTDIITNIIYNEKLRIVSQFKEWLIFDDQNEFLKRYYQYQESIIKLATIYEFYEANSKIFPNYVTLPESKYLFKNIKKKQKMLDNLNENKRTEVSNSSNNIFTSNIINSLLSSSTSNLGTTQSFQKIIQLINENEPIEPVTKNTSIVGRHKKFIKPSAGSKERKTPNSNKMANSTKVTHGKSVGKLNIANIEKNVKKTKDIEKVKPKAKAFMLTERAKKTLIGRPSASEKSKGTQNKLVSSATGPSNSTKKEKKIEAKSMPKLTYKDRLKSIGKLTKGVANKRRITSPQNPTILAVQYKQGGENNNLVKVTLSTGRPKTNVNIKKGPGKTNVGMSNTSKVSGVSGAKESTSKETKDLGIKYTPTNTISNSGVSAIFTGQVKANSRIENKSQTHSNKNNSDIQKNNIVSGVGTNIRGNLKTITNGNYDNIYSKNPNSQVESISKKHTPTTTQVGSCRRRGEIYPHSAHLNTPVTNTHQGNHSNPHNNKSNNNFHSNISTKNNINIKTKKPTMMKTSTTRYENYQKNIIHEKNIPSLHISFSKHFNTNSTNKNTSKSKSKSPNSNSTSLNKNINRNSCILKQNNLRTLIHKDILENTEDGRHTERIKPTKQKSINCLKSSTITKATLQIHKKMISATSSYDYNKIVPKTTRGNSNNKNQISSKINSYKSIKNNYNTIKVVSPNSKVITKQNNNSRGNSNLKNTKTIGNNTKNKKLPAKKIKNFSEAVKTSNATGNKKCSMIKKERDKI